MKKNIIIALLCIITIISIITSIHTIRANNRMIRWYEQREVTTVRVQPYDGMDKYWAAYAPTWMTREEYRAQIRELNDKSSDTLYAGEVIKIYIIGG